MRLRWLRSKWIQSITTGTGSLKTFERWFLRVYGMQPVPYIRAHTNSHRKTCVNLMRGDLLGKVINIILISASWQITSNEPRPRKMPAISVFGSEQDIHSTVIRADDKDSDPRLRSCYSPHSDDKQMLLFSRNRADSGHYQSQSLSARNFWVANFEHIMRSPCTSFCMEK